MNPAQQTITNTVIGWVASNLERIRQAHVLKGGWEGWAQVELATAFRNDPRFHTEWITTREDRVYAPQTGEGQKISDILVTAAAGGQNYTTGDHVIELKCESLHNKKKFVQAVVGDYDKIVKNQLRVDHRPCLIWMVALGVGEDAERDGDLSFMQNQRVSDQAGEPVTVWYWCMELE